MDLVKNIYESGVVGAGGAGFPTHIKYNTKAEYLLINAAECEPLLYTDQYEMENYPIEIIKGILLGKEALGANKAIIAIKSKHKKSIEALTKAIAELSADVTIHEMESFYPAGDEHNIIYEVLKNPLPPGKIPIDMGIVVSNVTSAKNIYRSTKNIPVVDKVVTVTGEVNEPSIINVPVGTSIKECIEAAGGSKISDYAVILGGPMMGKFIFEKDVSETFVTKTTGGIIVLPKNHSLVERKMQSLERIRNQTSSACIQCDFCTELCPRYLLGHPLRPHEVMKAFGFGDYENEMLLQASLCCECGICELYSCPMDLSPRLVNAHVKQELRKMGKKSEFESEGLHHAVELRKLPTDRLAFKIDIDQYYKIHDFKYLEIDPEVVNIPLSQHIGKPATAVVKVGDQVKKGDLLGDVDLSDMGARVHSSIDGVVEDVGENIKIRKRVRGE